MCRHETLEAGRAHVEARAGRARVAEGGAHAVFGTHNLLLGLEDGLYLEVIAVDPAAPAPGRARWFDLDRFAGRRGWPTGSADCDDLDARWRLHRSAGDPVALARGDLRWRMAVPGDGVLPFGGCFPAVIQWDGDAHPADGLAASGCRLRAAGAGAPRGAGVCAGRWRGHADARVVVEAGDTPALLAEIDTPHGRRGWHEGARPGRAMRRRCRHLEPRCRATPR